MYLLSKLTEDKEVAAVALGAQRVSRERAPWGGASERSAPTGLRRGNGPLWVRCHWCFSRHAAWPLQQSGSSSR